MQRDTVREAMAELLGTFVLMTFGLGVVAQVVLSDDEKGQYLSINIGWGLAVALAVYVSGGVSGGHLNPAVTLAMAVRRGFAWQKVPVFIAAQFVGAFVASALVYLTYAEALDAFDGGQRQVGGDLDTAGIWATYPQEFLSPFPGGVIDQIVGTGLLVLCVMALSDERNIAPKSNMAPLLVGSTVLLIGMTFGYNAGYAINPVRDFAPRVFTSLAGWGSEVFTANNNWWWVPIVGPGIGGVVGACLYDACITRFHTDEVPEG